MCFINNLILYYSSNIIKELLRYFYIYNYIYIQISSWNSLLFSQKKRLLIIELSLIIFLFQIPHCSHYLARPHLHLLTHLILPTHHLTGRPIPFFRIHLLQFYPIFTNCLSFLTITIIFTICIPHHFATILLLFNRSPYFQSH